MARVGQEMVNPVTRERFVWRHTAASTGGDFCEFDLYLGEDAVVAAPHVHPRQREDFRIESGTIRIQIDGHEETLHAGGERVVPAGTRHAWANAGPGEAHVVVRLTPALRAEDFFETFCGLARDGKTTSKGMPRNPLQFGVLALAFRHQFALASPVVAALAAPAVLLLAGVGRLAGYRSRYAKYGE